MSEANVPELRNMNFDLDSVPRYWHGGRRSITTFFNNLSVFFPAGERFFIASVKAHRDKIRTDTLRDQVKGFCGQEGVHSREHVRYNEMLAKQGFPVEELEKRVETLLKWVTKLSTKRRRLAVTCSLEHFTATMAHVLLSDDSIIEGAHPSMRSLWRWHAAEEMEHRSVAHDVYDDAGGNWFERSTTMIGTTLLFWGMVLEHQIRLMHADGTLYSPQEVRAVLEFLFVKPGGLRKLMPLYFPYFRPGFHPSEIDSDGLLARWKAEYQASAPVKKTKAVAKSSPVAAAAYA